MLSELRMDLQAYADHLDLHELGFFRKFIELIFRSTFVVVLLFRLSAGAWPGLRYGFRFLYKIAGWISGIQIPWSTKIGGGLVLPHYGTIVVNRWAVVGQNCTLLHNCTIAAKGRGSDTGVARVGSHVYVGAGACILGSVHLGDHCVIGANSVVTKDVPSCCIVAGNPARVLKQLATTSNQV